MSWSRYLTGLNLYVLPDSLDRILLPASLTGLQASSEELYSYSKIYQRRDPTELLEVPQNVSSFSCMTFAVLTFSEQIVDSVAGACNQICVHLSEPLYDLVLNMIYDYASTTVRSNAVRAIHQLVECVANAYPEKTLAKFLPFCARNIRMELENGASSVRTTSSTTPIPSDATLHWSMLLSAVI